MEPRKEVKSFAAMMEYKLKKNDHKGNFENTDVDFLLKRLKEEVVELENAIKTESYFEVMLEAADVANFACIIVWNILRNQVIGQNQNDEYDVEKIWSLSGFIYCDCDTVPHLQKCALRQYYRLQCSCSANGEYEKTHTNLCNINKHKPMYGE